MVKKMDILDVIYTLLTINEQALLIPGNVERMYSQLFEGENNCSMFMSMTDDMSTYI